jgi:hypothetical protein
MAQSINLGTSVHLYSIDLELRITADNLNPSFLIVAAKQGPAVGVIPVFNPLYPHSRSLFVFYQI